MNGKIIPLIALVGAAALAWFAFAPAKGAARALRPSTSRVPGLDQGAGAPLFYRQQCISGLDGLNASCKVRDFVAEFKNALRTVTPSILNLLRGAANAHNVPQNILIAQSFAESTLDPNAISSKTDPAAARGLMQLRPNHHPGVPVNKPIDNAYRGAEYLREKFDEFGDWRSALLAYTMGSKGFRTKTPTPIQTKYAADILRAAGVA